MIKLPEEREDSEIIFAPILLEKSSEYLNPKVISFCALICR